MMADFAYTQGKIKFENLSSIILNFSAIKELSSSLW